MRMNFKLSSLKRTHIIPGVGLTLLGLLVAGCPAGKAPPEVPVTDKIVIKGSNTVGEELAPGLIAEYKKDKPKQVIELETKGTGYGVAGLCAGVCNIGAASRPLLKAEQEQMQMRAIEFNDYVIGSYSVAVVANAANPVADLSREQVRDIFAGAISNWKQVGGPDAAIHPCIRDPVSGTYLGFRELAMENRDYTITNMSEFTNYAAIAEAVSKDPNAIGYVSLDLTGRSGVKALSIGGAAPTVAAVQGGKYPFARVLHLYTLKQGEPVQARDFVQFVLSPRGQTIVEQLGFVRRP